MRILTVISFLSTLWFSSFGQDGSDIRYFKVSGVGMSIVGHDVHFDFFRRSFGGRTIDTITININNNPIKFIERRKDDGFNNWFAEQYLESINEADDTVIRISKFRLDSIMESVFQVTMYIDFYSANDKLLNSKSRQVKYWFDKKNISEVLVKSKQV